MTVKDVHGTKVELPKGEEYRAFELSNGQVLLQDGKIVVINKGQFQNVKGKQTMLGEFADEGVEIVEKKAKGDAKVSGMTPRVAENIDDGTFEIWTDEEILSSGYETEEEAEAALPDYMDSDLGETKFS